MGQIRKQNEALTPGNIRALDEVAEEEWSMASTSDEEEKIEATMSMVMLTFCAELMGEEVSLVSLTGLLTFWEETTMQETCPHIMLTLHGRFKGENGVCWHCVPIALRTRSSLPAGKWIARLIKRRVFKQRVDGGLLFWNANGSRRKFGVYDPKLLDLLDKVKGHFPNVIHKITQIEDFSLWRSGRRGADMHIIDHMGRWRKREVAKGTEPGLPMRQVYTQMRSVFPAMLTFSGSM